MNTTRRNLLKKTLVAASVAALAGLTFAGSVSSAHASDPVHFDIVRSPGLNATPNCLPNARAQVTIFPGDTIDQMFVKAEGLPANTDFDFFVIQVPNAPFGMSWYQGDFHTNSLGNGVQVYLGRFSIETFIVAANTAPALEDAGRQRLHHRRPRPALATVGAALRVSP